MEEINDGGPALPIPEHEHSCGLIVGQKEGMNGWISVKEKLPPLAQGR